MSHSLSPRLRTLAAVPLCVLALGACFGGAGGGDDESGATAGDVDQSSEIAVTEEELAAFTAPADSVLTAAQVDAYLRTSLLQFDLVRQESGRLHEKLAQMEKRQKEGGALSALRNVADGVSTLTQMGELLGGSYVRSARTLKLNPAEMEWVRDRMGEVSGALMANQLQATTAQSSTGLKEQVAEMRRQLEAGQLPGYTAEQLDEMEKQADEMAGAMQGATGAAARNIEVLRRAKSNVTDPMWQALGWAGAGSGMMAFTGLANPQDTTAKRQLDELRVIFTAALENKVAPGMEVTPPADAAAPAAPTS
jgi:hypothetical protein